MIDTESTNSRRAGASSSTAQLSLARPSHLWHQMTRESDWRADPRPMVERASGAFFWDVAGRRMIDGNSGLQNVNIGHGRETMAEVAASQVRSLDYFPVFNGSHILAEQLADELHARLPWAERFYLVNSGSEGVDLSLKLLAEYWRLRGQDDRTVVIARRGSYHGATLGALAPTGIPALRDPFSRLLIETVRIGDPLVEDAEDEAQAVVRLGTELSSAIERCGPRRVLAVVAEPVQLWDVPIPPDDYWPRLRRVCDEYDVPLVADEVITGFGRTGRWFGMDHWGVEPDVNVLGKGIASGYAPIGAVGVRSRICATFDESTDGILHHISTTSGHPLACALALENIRVIEAEGLVSRCAEVGELLRAELRSAFENLPCVSAVSGMGLLNTVLFDPDSEPLRGARQAESARLRSILIRNGAYLRVDGQIWFIPPLCTEPETLTELVDIAKRAVEEWASPAG